MSILELLKINKTAEPPFEYNFIYNLPEKEYPEYLKKLFKYKTKEELPLKREKGRTVIDKSRCRTFNQKIQWLKLYDAAPLKKLCTDKADVRDYVKEKIGAEYLKPALQIITKDKLYIYSHRETCNEPEKTALDFSHSFEMTRCCHSEPAESRRKNPEPININNYSHSAERSSEESQTKRDSSASKCCLPQTGEMKTFNYPIECESLFDLIDFDSLPDKFVMKCTHGCKWHYIIKDKNKILADKQLYYKIRQKMTGWLEQKFCFFEGFEMQYKDLEPKIIIEPLMRDNGRHNPAEINVYCFNGIPKLVMKQCIYDELSYCCYDEKFNVIEPIFTGVEDTYICQNADENIKIAFELSKKLSRDFKFVRADWMIYQNKIYFGELTFTPYSGFTHLSVDWNKKLGSWLEI